MTLDQLLDQRQTVITNEDWNTMREADIKIHAMYVKHNLNKQLLVSAEKNAIQRPFSYKDADGNQIFVK